MARKSRPTRQPDTPAKRRTPTTRKPRAGNDATEASETGSAELPADTSAADSAGANDAPASTTDDALQSTADAQGQDDHSAGEGASDHLDHKGSAFVEFAATPGETDRTPWAPTQDMQDTQDTLGSAAAEAADDADTGVGTEDPIIPPDDNTDATSVTDSYAAAGAGSPTEPSDTESTDALDATPEPWDTSVGDPFAGDALPDEASLDGTDAGYGTSQDRERAADSSASDPASQDVSPPPAIVPAAAQPAGNAAGGDDRAPPAPRKGGALPLILGGVVAAVIGGGAVYFAVNEGWLPAPGAEIDLSAYDARMDTLSEQLAALEDRVSDVAATESVAPQDLTAAEARLENRLDALDTGLAGLSDAFQADMESIAEARAVADEVSGALGTLLNRLESTEAAATELQASTADLGAAGAQRDETLSALSTRIAATQSAQDALSDEIADVRALAEARLADVQAEAAAAAAEADARAARAEATAALDSVEAALQGGMPFAPALARVAPGVDDLPAALHAVAEDGVATLTELQERFTPAARTGLGAALQGVETDSTADRLGNFFRSQVGARSLQPRDGDDPDAVMSRATQAVRDGDIPRALSELGDLPDAGRAAMSGWISAAENRVAALDAFDTLKQTLTAE